MRTKGKTAAPKSCEECVRWKEIRRKVRISKLLADAIGAVEESIKAKNVKPTMGDYLKLLQLEQEIEDGSPKDIEVRWVEPEAGSAGK